MSGSELIECGCGQGIGDGYRNIVEISDHGISHEVAKEKKWSIDGQSANKLGEKVRSS